MRMIVQLKKNGKDVVRKTSKEQIMEIVEKTWREVLPILAEKYPNFKTDFPVSLNSRLKTTGGRVLITRATGLGKMELNERLLANNLEQVRMVFIHELAHLVEHQEYGSTNHGYRFQRVMTSLGCEATTSHDMDTSELKPKRKYHVYSCECGNEHEMSVRAHNFLMKRGGAYVCNRSKTRISFDNYLRSEVAKKSIIG